jgi:3-deoxy-D-manno-octulosonate 8-phosphate phosphatase (KDO 8-P phosphatase)
MGKSIKLLILDVDGTLTDATVYYTDNHIETKAFSTKDGCILKPLPKIGIDVVFMTGRRSEAVARRAEDLRAVAIQGIEDKATKLLELCEERGITLEQCAFIGDDLNDYNAMSLCGFKACPADSAVEIREICDYVSPFNGGHGAVRDICERMLKKMGLYQQFVDYYLVEKRANV